MFPLLSVSVPRGERLAVHEDARSYLRGRMEKPQRHRLLHGYPLAAALKRREPGREEDDLFYVPVANRGLLVGVLPHPFCNPAVTGCGFCTFPHEKYHADLAAAVVEHVIREVRQRVERQPSLHRRPVDALYFGGGTANLTPPASFRALCRSLAETFDLSAAEITLEGVPAYFLKRQPLLLDILCEELPARHFRLSMGLQTFDEAMLRRMGRLAFGTERTFAEVVELGHRLGFTVSADLLFNLPGQGLEQMRQDVERADAIGLDHLGLYHLVLFRGLGTAWSRDEEMLTGLPSNEEACGNWLNLRELLLSRGFGQTTLTNFERRAFQGDPCRFVYEDHSFHANRFDMLGFGPSAISFAADRSFRTAHKIVNPDSSSDYLTAVATGRPAWDRYFDYQPLDLRIFHLTRRLAAVSIERDEYEALFGRDVVEEFAEEIEATVAERLVKVTRSTIQPTLRGIFHADSIAALLAWRPIHARRAPLGNDNGRGYM
jgi:coproporphyrinogen III oxidase-like Fe-S oxidoreductase